MIHEMEEAARRATPGPWFDCDFTEVTDDKTDTFEISCTWPDFIGVAAITSGGFVGTREQKELDAKFIALANPENILRLCELLKKMGEALKHYAEQDMRNARHYPPEYAKETLAEYEVMK